MIDTIRKWFGELNFSLEMQDLYNWISSLSERSLMLTAITIFHCMFTPQMLTFMNGLGNTMPSLDSFLLLVGGLSIMALRSVLINDKICTLVHLAGFVSQLVIVCMVFMK